MQESLAIRIAATGQPPEFIDAVLDYTTPVPLFSSGAEAAAHGLQEVTRPSAAAQRTMGKLERRRQRNG
jgi:hypothetical protein